MKKERPLSMVLATLLSITFIGAFVGCGPHVRRPNMWNPGNAASQQFDAIQHDPYPMDDLGEPVVGGRPMEYQVSVPQAMRGQLSGPAPSLRVSPPGG